MAKRLDSTRAEIRKVTNRACYDQETGIGEVLQLVRLEVRLMRKSDHGKNLS